MLLRTISKITNMGNLNLANRKPNLIILYKLIKKTIERLTICYRREFYIKEGIPMMT